MPRTPSTHSSSNAAPVRTAQRVRPPRPGDAGGRDADRRDDGWGPHGTAHRVSYPLCPMLSAGENGGMPDLLC